MSDVFDEDLIKELGLDPEDVMGPKGPTVNPQSQQQKPALGPSAQARATMGQAPKPAAKPPTFAKPPLAPEHKQAPIPHRVEAKPTPATFETEAVKVSENIPVHVAAVLAKRSLPLKDVLDLKAGEIVEFKKTPQEPIDLVANGRLIGKCELVLVDGKLGARILKLVN